MVAIEGFIKQWLQLRLRGGAQYRCGAVSLHKLGNRPYARPQIRHRQRLRLVEDDNRIRYVVQLTASRGCIRVQAFKELHRRGDHDRRVPVLRGKRAPEIRFIHVGLVLELVRCLGVVGQHGVRSKNRLELAYRLIDNRRIRNHVNDASQIVGARMFEGERDRGNGFAAASGGSKRI